MARGNSGEFDAPAGLYRCLGDDAYVAVTIDGNGPFADLAGAIGRPELATDSRYRAASSRVEHREELDRMLEAWTAQLSSVDAQDRLQTAGVAAGAAVHAFELLANPQLIARGQFGKLPQPGYDDPLDSEMGPALFEHISPPELRPAPLMAADTEVVCRQVLGLSDDEIEELEVTGVLEMRRRAAARIGAERVQ